MNSRSSLFDIGQGRRRDCGRMTAPSEAIHLISELKLRPLTSLCLARGLLTQAQYLFPKISLLLVIVPEVCKSAPTSSHSVVTASPII